VFRLVKLDALTLKDIILYNKMLVNMKLEIDPHIFLEFLSPEHRNERDGVMCFATAIGAFARPGQRTKNSGCCDVTA
jgi:hypothetical protein